MIRTCYCYENDMTFIIDETPETLEAVGFYFGEPDQKLIRRYAGNLTAKFDLDVGFFPRGLSDVYCVDDDMTFILEGSANGSELTLTGFYFGEPNDADTEKFNGSLVAEFDEPVDGFYSSIRAYKSVRKYKRFAFSNKDILIDRLTQNAKRKQYASARRKFVRK